MPELTTEKNWNDLLPGTAINNLKEVLQEWVQNKKLFADPGKQRVGLYLYGGDAAKRRAVAALAGLHTGRKVYKVDAAAIGANYIGETEKNLHAVFAEAEQGNWILFFDEADALFGKRSSIEDSHDRYANRETGWLLQRIEAGNTLLILSGDGALIDMPFAKHFFAMIDCAV